MIERAALVVSSFLASIREAAGFAGAASGADFMASS
jgi:hypothetical protein